MGFKIVAYPLDLLYSSIKAMQESLEKIAVDQGPGPLEFDELKQLVRLPQYNSELQRFANKL